MEACKPPSFAGIEFACVTGAAANEVASAALSASAMDFFTGFSSYQSLQRQKLGCDALLMTTLGECVCQGFCVEITSKGDHQEPTIYAPGQHAKPTGFSN